MSVPDTRAIREGLEATRGAYQELLASLSLDDWKRKSGNPDMTVKELMWHLAWALSWISRSLGAVQGGRNFNPPAFIVDPLRAVAMRVLARGATPERAAQRYDQGHATLLAKLDAMQDREWASQAKIFGEVRDPEFYFRLPVSHFEEHAGDVRLVIGSTPHA